MQAVSRFPRFTFSAALVMLATLAIAPKAGAAPQASADVTVTADNAYMVGYGPVTGPRYLTAAVQNSVNADIYSCATGPELHADLNVIQGDTHLYIVSWSDDAQTSGVLAQVFTGAGTKYYSGTSCWEVYATGIDLDAAGPAPSLAAVQGQVVIANANGGAPGTTSTGWVGQNSGPPGSLGRLAIGEANDVEGSVLNCPTPGNVFGIVCQAGANGIDAAAKWMWYNPTALANPFCADGSSRGEYLIFRAPINGCIGAVPAAGTWSLLLMGLLTLVASGWFLWKREVRVAV